MTVPVAGLLVVLLIAAIVTIPRWGFVAKSYYPSAVFATAFLIILAAWLLGYLGS